MPRTKTTPPKEPTRETGQRSLDLPDFLFRVAPHFRQPTWMKAERWRNFVRKQPVAVATRDALISYILALEWKIEPRDSDDRDELKDEIDEWTRFFEYDGNYDYAERLERLLEDALDTPFGGAMETIRVPDNENGKVVSLVPLDAATLFPTLSVDYPIGQVIPELAANDTVYFPKHAVNRIYYAPRPEIMREGWGMPPPERIYLAMELLARGDNYYADLLLDVPEAGILDLMDMDRESAKAWVDSFKNTLLGGESFKIPVLYEHTTKAEFIPFRMNPAELMFDDITLKYAAVVTSGYGMTLSDIGFPSTSSGGETLAGSIRQERKTRRTALSRWKLKVSYWHNRILPPYLKFLFIDLDDELAVAKGRARLATATAMGALIDNRIISPSEARQQMIADGLFSISLSEEAPDESEFPELPSSAPERPSMLGRPVAPSEGGHGEVVDRGMIEKGLDSYLKLDNEWIVNLARQILPDVALSVKYDMFENQDGMWNGVIDEIVSEYQDSFEDPESLDELIIEESLSKINLPDASQADTISIAEDYLRLIEDADEKIKSKFVEEASYEAEKMLSTAAELSRAAVLSGIVEGLQNPLLAYSIATLDTDELLSDNKVVKSIVFAIKSRFEKIRNNLIEQYIDNIMQTIKNLEE